MMDAVASIREQLYVEEQQRAKRKRKRGDSGSEPTGHLPMVINNYIPARPWQAETDSDSSLPRSAHGPTRSMLTIPGLRDDAVGAYHDYHCSRVKSENQKRHYGLARDLTLERAFDLDLMHDEGDTHYYIDRGVLEGVARR